MEVNSKCYSFQRLEVVEGLFDSSVDATYVITLENNGRYERVKEQLQKYHPTRILYIATNKGYKRCKKDLHKDLPAYDLTDAFINVFKHANEQGYKNILVLEDDFIFSDKIFDQSIRSTVNTFISARTDTNFIYLLGCLPQFLVPYDSSHYIPVQSGGTHAVVYSRQFRDQSIREYTTTVIEDWDIYCKSAQGRYTYYEPLAYQLFPVTENSEHWFDSEFLVRIARHYLKVFRLDIDIEPGYSLFYSTSKILFYISIALVLLFIVFLARITLTLTSKTLKSIRRTTRS
jgi:hypothetical protein